MPSAKYTPYGIDDLSDFKVWRLQNPNAHKLLKEIIFKWRGSNAKVKGRPGRWTVWPIQQWAEWTGLSSDQTERALRCLELEGLIRRERHRWAGSTVRAFIQPTKLALQHMGRPGDLERLSTITGEVGAGNNAGASAGTGAGTDYTSLPFSPTKSSKKKKKEAEFSCGEGKGKAATSGSPPPQTLTPQSPPLPSEPVVFPILKGKHEKYVKHPSEMYPKWPGFSLAIKIKLQEKYESYVDNWYAGKQGKPYTPVIEMTDEEWAEFSAELAAFPDDEEEFIASYKLPKASYGG